MVRSPALRTGLKLGCSRSSKPGHSSSTYILRPEGLRTGLRPGLRMDLSPASRTGRKRASASSPSISISFQAGLQMGRRAGWRMDPKAGWRMDHRAGLPMDHRAGLPMDRRAGLPMGRRAGLPMGRRAGLPMGPRAGSPMGRRAGWRMGRRAGLPTGLGRRSAGGRSAKPDPDRCGRRGGRASVCPPGALSPVERKVLPMIRAGLSIAGSGTPTWNGGNSLVFERAPRRGERHQS
jgi:hypothetical protein